MDKTIYIVSKLWTDSLENDPDRAIGYSPVGFIYEGEQKYIKIRNINTGCWAAFGEEKPDFILTKLEHING